MLAILQFLMNEEFMVLAGLFDYLKEYLANFFHELKQ